MSNEMAAEMAMAVFCCHWPILADKKLWYPIPVGMVQAWVA